jgi:hypothetical protein
MLANRHSRQRFVTALAAVLVLPLAACPEAQEQLYISSNTVLGVDASVNTARTSGRVQLGYDRYFVTWVPQTVKQDGEAREVMSALNCTEVTFGSLALLGFEESLATGVAAQNFSRQLAADATGNAYFECFHNRASNSR